MTPVTEGSLWGTADGRQFRVLAVVEVQGHTWVHYVRDQGMYKPAGQEYSCYVESFVERFQPKVNESR